MLGPHADSTAVLLLDGTVLLVDRGSAEVYDPATDRWSAAPVPELGFGWGFQLSAVRAALLWDGRVLVTEGWTRDGGTQMPPGNIGSAQIYDPIARTWTARTIHSYGGHQAVMLGSGHVLVTSRDGADLYDPVSGRWSYTGPMTARRNGSAASLLPDGRVLVTGGGATFPDSADLSSTEIYDPWSDTWTAGDRLQTARFGHFQVLLRDGNILIAGGANSGGRLTTAELGVATTPSLGHARGGFDSNADGRNDIFRYDAATGSWVLSPSDGHGGFGLLLGSWSSGWNVRPADFNSDRPGDLFVYNSTTGRWFKCLGDGFGHFTYAGGTWSSNWQVSIGDFDGDRRSDVFVYNPTTGAWFTCLTTGTDGSGFACTGGHWSPGWQIVPLDLDGNGRTDVFAYNDTTGQWYRCLSDGTGGFRSSPGIWTSRGWHIATGDFNGDSRDDLFLYSATTGQWFVCTSTDTGFEYRAGVWSPNWTVRTGDLDGDGRTDVFVYNRDSGAWYECLSTDAGFTYTGGSWSPGWQVWLLDLDGDGRADVFVYNPANGMMYQCLNTGAASFTCVASRWSQALTIVTGQ